VDYADIIVPDGGMKNPFTANSLTDITYGPLEARNSLQMRLNGANIFNFALREVAPNIKTLLSYYNVELNTVDYFILHQANKLILDCVCKKLNQTALKFPKSLYHYGNTSSASIPLTILTELKEEMQQKRLNLLLSGFGSDCHGARHTYLR
jgi:3-oxoacyl-[acyl-carrier-protein] synthase-3